MKLPKWLLNIAAKQLDLPPERYDTKGGVLSAQNAEVNWVTRDGRKITIGQMTEMHAKNALALFVRNVIEQNKVAYRSDNGKVHFANRMDNLCDDMAAIITDDDEVVTFEPEKKVKITFKNANGATFTHVID